MNGTHLISLVILLSLLFEYSASAHICGQGRSEYNGEIVGGTQTTKGDWPWLVALTHGENDDFFCGGSLISAKHVLSAAHCFQYKMNPEIVSARLVKANLGKYDLRIRNETGSRSHSIREIVIHPDWRFNHHKFDADIAILLLEEPTEFSSFVQPICLPAKNSDDVIGTGTVVGWGKVANTSDSYSSTPKQLQVPAINSDTCYTTFEKLARYSSARMFCGGFANQSKSTCFGDSGGGFYSTDGYSTDGTPIWSIRGIASGGLVTATRQCDMNSYTLFTNVAKFLDWIFEIMEKPTHCLAEFL